MHNLGSVQEFNAYLASRLCALVLAQDQPSKGREPSFRPTKLIVGFSGGLDSTVLLHALTQLVLPSTNARPANPRPISLCALHIHHGLSSNADSWTDHCRQMAIRLNVEFQVYEQKVVKEGKGTESAARDIRYQAFANALSDEACLVTAHHRGDQAETLLYRLMRGAGVAGLAAIPAVRQWAGGWLLRPLLGLSCAELRHYALKHNLTWIDDESNSQTDFDRNYLRHTVLPSLQSRWPAAEKKIAQTANMMADAQSLLDQYSEIDFDYCQPREEKVGDSISIERWRSLSVLRQRQVLRYWVNRRAWMAPSLVHFEQIDLLVEAKEQASPIVTLGAYEFRRHAGRLFLLPVLPAVDHRAEYHWSGDMALALVDGGTLAYSNAVGPHAAEGPFFVRYRRGGDRCHPISRMHSQTLKKVLQEHKLEPWLRERVPLVFKEKELIAVGDLFLCKNNCLKEEQNPFVWQY